jgi:cephalosporin hydroxylase
MSALRRLRGRAGRAMGKQPLPPPTLSPELERMLDPSRTPIEQRLGEPVGDLWTQRIALHFQDSYAGVPMTKFPEDLRVYEHLLWEARPNVVVEVGVHRGASALWFRDRLRTLESYGRTGATRFIGVDTAMEEAIGLLDAADPRWRDEIVLIEGDIRERATVERVLSEVPADASCLVVEDSAHQYDTTLASLRGLARLVRPGGFFVVEDGSVDVEAMRFEEDWPRGVLPAVAEWLAGRDGRDFVRRRDLELYGMTCHPGGFLQRRLS